ncbi:MAG: adenosylmethionine--8-amino-7-oxononanoate transaminase [Thermodesulfovibrionales bacterium]|nr:adenosylmethionine--8-amino-7-oxononanoate transaminase [Thermodesulfovibrionales bacterium]
MSSQADEINRLIELDRLYLWHPFTQMKEWMEREPVIIVEGRDCFIKDVKGRWYLDGVSSLWVNIHGHKRKEINDAIKAQLDLIAHSTLLGMANVPSILLAERLIKLVPEGLKKVFYSDNGSTSVEVALKMAFQYWIHRGEKGKTAFLCLNNAYHGDTLGAVSVGGIDIFHSTFKPLLFKTYRAPSTYCYRCELEKTYPECRMECLSVLEDILSKHHEEIAALIIEPLIQAAGGMITQPPGYLKGVRELCSKYNILMIADEVATGFGRTGRMFAVEHEEVIPDIMCLSKGITGGYLPLAATISTEEIFNAFLGRFEEAKTFFHGHSYTGNQLGCAAALASLDIFEKDRVLEHLQPKIEFLKERFNKLREHENIGDIRQCGFMAGIELVRDRKTKESFGYIDRTGWKVAYEALKRGLFIRPLGNIIVIMPPLSISMENLEKFLDIIEDSINTVMRNV